MDTSIFEELGLTNSEVKTYMALLDLGSSTAGPLLEKSGLQNSVVHRALNTLIEKGLINYVLEGKRKIYQATDPEQFYNYIDDKKKKFQDILPELKQRQQLALQHKPETASIYKGKRGIMEVYQKLVSLKAKEYNTFGGGEQTVNCMGMHFWLNIHKRRVENKLPARQVWDETVRKPGADILKNPMTSVRFLAHEMASFQETVIVGDHVAITVFTDTPYSFLIIDQQVADSYRKYFELLWKLAKP
ncbi:MAG: helix-turn-helix domain-containing protein [archaeon]